MFRFYNLSRVLSYFRLEAKRGRLSVDLGFWTGRPGLCKRFEILDEISDLLVGELIGVRSGHHGAESGDDLRVGIGDGATEVGVIGGDGFPRFEGTTRSGQALPRRTRAGDPVQGVTGETSRVHRQHLASCGRLCVDRRWRCVIGRTGRIRAAGEQPEPKTEDEGQPHREYGFLPGRQSWTELRIGRNRNNDRRQPRVFGGPQMSALSRHQHRLTRRQFMLAVGGAATSALFLPVTPASALSIHPRSSWAIDRPPKGPLAAEEVRFLIVHHSASRNGHTSADAPGILRSFYDFHTGPEKGWNDIAYNFLIDSGGDIWEGRHGSLDGPIAGDATGGNQGFSQLVCIIGDYNAVQPTGASVSSLVSLLSWLADRYAISTAPGSEVTFTSRGSNRWAAGSVVTTRTITGHRTMSQTTCPGNHLNAYVEGGLMADVTAVRGGQTASTTTPSTTTTTLPTTTTTLPPTTTTQPPPTTTTTTVPSTTVPPTTTLPPTTIASSTSSTLAPTTTVTSITAISPPSTSSSGVGQAAVAASPTTTDPSLRGGGSGPVVLGVSALAATIAGVVAWRSRRMGG